MEINRNKWWYYMFKNDQTYNLFFVLFYFLFCFFCMFWVANCHKNNKNKKGKHFAWILQDSLKHFSFIIGGIIFNSNNQNTQNTALFYHKKNNLMINQFILLSQQNNISLSSHKKVLGWYFEEWNHVNLALINFFKKLDAIKF